MMLGFDWSAEWLLNQSSLTLTQTSNGLRSGNTNRPRKGLCRGYEALVSCIIPWQLSSAAAQQTGLSGSED